MTEPIELTRSDVLQLDQSFCLNNDEKSSLRNLFMGDESLYLRSDCDEQLLIHLAFRSTVKLTHISVDFPNDESAPSSVKLFINEPNPSFGGCEDSVPTQVVPLGVDGTPSGERASLKITKFLRVDSLTIFIDENGGADNTQLSCIRVFGHCLDDSRTVNVSKIHEKKES